MLSHVEVARTVEQEDVLQFLSPRQRKSLLKITKELYGRHIVHFNATPQGGGVAEILKSLVPYTQAFEIPTDWYAIDAATVGTDFFRITDIMRDGLQGQEVRITPEEWSVYATVNKELARQLEDMHYDLLVVHDWQPAFAGFYLQKPGPRVFVSHIDTSSAFEYVADAILQAMKAYDITVFSNKQFVNRKLPKKRVRIIPPAIDPLILKQKLIPQEEAREFLASYGIPKEGRLIAQVSRFDVWKDPFGVVEAFTLVQETYPDAILVLLGLQEADDNPAALAVFEEVKRMAAGNPNIILFFDPVAVGGNSKIAEFTMMVQNAADVVVQNSKKEGFGLTVTEAMWKGKPVVGGSASGIKRQITSGKNGYIVHTPQELSQRIIEVLSDKEKQKQIGRAARKSVAQQFLLPRLLFDYIKIYKELL